MSLPLGTQVVTIVREARLLFSGPDPDTVTNRGIEWAATTADNQPGSVLCLTQSHERAESLQDRWNEEHDQLRVTATTLDAYVSDLYERATGNLADSTPSRVQRFRLAESAIEQYGSTTSDGPFAGITSPANDLIDQVQGIFSLLQYAGYDSPAAIEQALLTAGAEGDETLSETNLYGSFRATDPPVETSALAEQAETFAGLYAEYERLRAELYPEWQNVTAEHYITLLDNDQLLPAVAETVDVIMLDGLTRLAPAEREVVACLADAYPTIAALPLTHNSLDGQGLDAGVERALTVYRALDFELEYHAPEQTNEARLSAVRSLYRPATEETPTVTTEDANITFEEPATEREEVRLAARRVRELLAEGVDPETIGVVVTDRATYRSLLAEVFSAYEIPFTFVNEIGIEQTLVGNAVQSLLDLTSEESQTGALHALASNPLVSLDAFDIETPVLTTAITQTTEQTLGAVLDTLYAEDHDQTAAGVRELVAPVTDTDSGLVPFTKSLEDVLDKLGLADGVAAYQQPGTPTGSHRPAYEESAWSAVQRVLGSFEPVAPYLTETKPAGRVRRAILAELVSGPRQQPGYVRVLPIAEAELASFEHLFALGLTAGYFPSDSETMAFFEAVNDADEEFGREDTGQRTQYIFGSLITGSTNVILSTPQHTVDGAEHMPAPVLSELKRYVDDTVTGADSDPPLVSSEDVQQAYTSWAVNEEFDTPTRPADTLSTADGLSPTAQTFAAQGATGMWRRSQPGVTNHEAQLADTVDIVYPDTRREPFSPSALEDYARCPYVFLMKQVLGFEEDYGDDEGLTRADRGIYIHTVLASFYRQLRTEFDQPVDLSTVPQDTLETTLLDVALTELDEIAAVDSPFERRTIGRLLAGLGTADDNPYYEFGGAETDGLFARFLETEIDSQAGVATQPTYFEGAISTDRDGVEELSADPVPIDTPSGSVTVRGITDRVDTSTGQPREMHIRDYKTGQTPGRADIAGGTKLQLPVYGLALETALENRTGVAHETIAGSYYKLKSPDDINATAGQLTYSDVVKNDAQPLVPSVSQSWRLPFEERAEYREFTEDVTATRLGRIATAIENGAFQPTLLSADQANCEDCAFRQSCDVRHHHQRDTIAALDEREHYISERARNEELDVDAYTDGGAD